MSDTPDIPVLTVPEWERTTIVDLNVEPKSSTGLAAWGPQDIAWYTPAGCYYFDYMDVIGAGASGALQVYSLGLSGGGGGGAWGRRAYNTYPGQYFAIRVGYGGAGASLAGPGAQQGGTAGGRSQVDDLIYVEGGWGGNTNGVGGSGGRWEYSWGATSMASGGRGGNVSGAQAASGGGGAAGWNGPGFNGLDAGNNGGFPSIATNGGQANNGYGAGGGAGVVQGTGNNGWPGFEYAGGTLGSGGGGGAGFQTFGAPYGGGGGWYGGGGGACVQTAAYYAAYTHPGAGGICVIQYRVYGAIVVSSCAPTGGPLVGGTYVTVYGSGFENVHAVTFAGVGATGITVHSDGVLTCYAPAHAAGLVDISVHATAGVGTGYIYTYFNPASVTAVTPNNGSTNGGNAVTVNGSGFSNGISSVQFGGAVASGVGVVNDNTLTCYTPAHSAGVVTVSVYTPYGDGHGNSLFTYIEPPTVSSVTPNAGSQNGGLPVTINGANMDGVSSVTFGGVAAASFAVASSSAISAVTPAHAPGPVDVVVANGYGSGTGVGVYTFLLLPVITSCTPSTGPEDLPTSVVIAGANFTGATSVTFDGLPATNVVVVSDAQITCDTPIHTPATVDIVITTPNGAGTGVSLFSYLQVLQSALKTAIIMP